MADLHKKAISIFYAAILSSSFFMGIVFLDKLMEKSVAPYSRVAFSHLIILFILLIIIFLLPGKIKDWGINLGHWKRSLILGCSLGLVLALLFSLFSYGTNISHWNITHVITQLKDRQYLILLLSQIFLIGTSEELLFRGVMMTYLMKQFTMRLFSLHVAVIIVSIMFASVHFYKLLFGATFGNIFPFIIGGFFYGLVLGWLYQETRSLIGPTILHNLCNSCVFLINLGIKI